MCAYFLVGYTHKEGLVKEAAKPTVRDSQPTARVRETARALSVVPAVKRLYGLASVLDLAREDVRQFLARKYGVDADARGDACPADGAAISLTTPAPAHRENTAPRRS